MRLLPFRIRNILFKCNFSNGKVPTNPRPIPLGNPKDQKEIDRSIREGSGQDLKQTIINENKKEFEGEKNPGTGEVGGPKGKEPTRFGDWEKNGRTTDF